MGLTRCAPLSPPTLPFWSKECDTLEMAEDSQSTDAEDAQSTVWIQAVLEAAHTQVRAQTWTEHGLLSRVCFAKEQLQILKKYQRICARLERYGAQLLTKQQPLVTVHFPVRPLPNTRVSMAEGVSRALVSFCRQLHETTLAVAPERLAPILPIAMAKLVAFVQTVATKMWEVSELSMDSHDGVLEERRQIIESCHRFAEECVREERVVLDVARDECDALACALRDFLDKRRLTERQLKRRTNTSAAQADIMKTWLRGLIRRGHGGAMRALRTRRAFNDAMKASANHKDDWWISASVQDIEDAFERMSHETPENAAIVEDVSWASCRYNALCRVGEWLMKHAVSEGDDLRWLEEQGDDASCWCSTCIVSDTPEVAMVDQAPLLQAPGHLGVFAKGRLRLLAPAVTLNQPKYTELAGVRMARLLAALLQNGHLPLDKLGCDYANRIVVCEYCKYERAVLAIEAETLVPLGELVNVPYESRVPDLATARLAQVEAHSL